MTEKRFVKGYVYILENKVLNNVFFWHQDWRFRIGTRIKTLPIITSRTQWDMQRVDMLPAHMEGMYAHIANH